MMIKGVAVTKCRAKSQYASAGYAQKPVNAKICCICRLLISSTDLLFPCTTDSCKPDGEAPVPAIILSVY